MKSITSASNPAFKRFLRLLQSSRERRDAGLSLLDGVHLVQTYVDHVGTPPDLLVSKSGATTPEIARLIEGRSWTLLPDGLFRQLSSVETPSGIIAVVPTPRAELPDQLGDFVLLEDIQDPGNVGSILRTAAAAGVPHVLLTRGCVHAWSPRVLRAGMGAHFMIRIVEGVDPHQALARFGGCVVAAATRGAQSLWNTDLRGTVGFLLGNEGAGLSDQLVGQADVVASIPMSGSTESLNVAAAAAILLFERARQKST